VLFFKTELKTVGIVRGMNLLKCVSRHRSQSINSFFSCGEIPAKVKKVYEKM